MLANVGIPMLMVVWPPLWMTLLPVVVLEAEWARRTMGWSRIESYKVASLGNVVSTAVGIPLAWVAMLALQFLFQFATVNVSLGEIGWPYVMALFPINSAWLPSYADRWLILLAFCVLSIPFCLISIVFERWVAIKLIPGAPRDTVNLWLRRANIASYLGLNLAATIYTAQYGV